MPFRFTRIAVAIAALAIPILPASDSVAQMSNRPFAFNTAGPSGVGMSDAGRQAIIGKKLFGSTPDTLLRTSDGRLLIGPVRGPGKSAIVFSPSGESLPGYRRDFRNGRAGLTAGAFNAFFIPRNSDRSVSSPPVAAASDALVSTWTTRVLSDSGIGYGRSSPVLVWTGSVYDLGPRVAY